MVFPFREYECFYRLSRFLNNWAKQHLQPGRWNISWVIFSNFSPVKNFLAKKKQLQILFSMRCCHDYLWAIYLIICPENVGFGDSGATKNSQWEIPWSKQLLLLRYKRHCLTEGFQNRPSRTWFTNTRLETHPKRLNELLYILKHNILSLNQGEPITGRTGATFLNKAHNLLHPHQTLSSHHGFKLNHPPLE